MLVVSLFAVVTVVPVVTASELLPDYMLGNFELDTSQGFEQLMVELGVGWLKRKIACGLTPVQEISQTSDGEITLDTLTTFSSTYTKFRLNQPFQESTADGRETTTTATVKGNRLIKVQIPGPDSGSLKVTEVRQFIDNGDSMRLINSIEGGATSVRVYRRVKE